VKTVSHAAMRSRCVDTGLYATARINAEMKKTA
jgi:hypothetical protein